MGAPVPPSASTTARMAQRAGLGPPADPSVPAGGLRCTSLRISFGSSVGPETLTEALGVCALDGWIGVRLREVTASITNEFVEVSGRGDVVCETGGNVVARERTVQVVVVV